VDAVDRVVRLLDAGVAPTVADLEEAEELTRSAPPRSLEVAVARWRIAIMLERLGRPSEMTPAAA
jgi:hypothetical protein